MRAVILNLYGSPVCRGLFLGYNHLDQAMAIEDNGLGD